MHFITKDGETIHISHFMHLLSAYCNVAEKQAELYEDIKETQLLSKQIGKPIAVDQDVVDFCLVIYPNGRIALFARMFAFDKII